MSYDSGNDSGDDLFADNAQQDTVATLPLPDLQQQPSAVMTQPTQPLYNSVQQKPLERSSSPSVQVSASSPVPRAWSSSTTPRPPVPATGGFNGGLASIMAPPGTQFRPPSLHPSSQFTQTQTQHLDISDDELPSSDGPDRSADIKPSSFIPGSRALNTGPYRVAESPFKNYASKFAYQSPQKRSADAIADASIDASKPKIPRQTAPARAAPIQLVVDDNMTLADVEDYNIAQKVKLMRNVLSEHSVATCYRALTLKRGHYEDALDYLVNSGAQVARDLKHTVRPRNHDTVDLTSEGDEEPLPDIKTAKRDIGKSASINQKWSSTQATSTKQQPTVPARSINDKYASTQRPANKTGQLSPIKVQQSTASKKPGRILGRRKAPSLPESSIPATSPVKSSSGLQRRRNVVDDDEDEGDESEARGSDDDSGVEITEDGSTNGRLLDLFNSGSTAELLDLSGSTTPDVIDKVLAQRPFSSLEKVRAVTVQVASVTKTGNTRTSRQKIGEKLVDTCLNMLTGFTAVDELVRECEKLAQLLARDMKQWGLNAFGTTSKNGNLDLFDLESPHDSGIGTPSSTPSHDGDGPLRRKLLKQPRMLNEETEMMDHQIAGLNWLSLLYTHELSGILADDMGLGKTLQIIAYLTHLHEAQLTSGPHLVIVPGSTMESWLQEFRKHSPSLRVEPYYGGINERPARQVQILQELDAIQVVVTTYDMAIKPDDLKFLRKGVKPVICVWDEAHELKNSQSKKYKSLIRIPARQRIMMTGTPVQNNLTEMASLLAFLMPELFAHREEDLQVIFKNKAKLDTSGTSKGDNKSALLSADRIARARSMITPFILRRKKHQVLSHLPKKIRNVEYCKLEGSQAKLYAEKWSSYLALLKKRRGPQPDPKLANHDEVHADPSTKKRRTAAEIEKSKDEATTSILTDLRKAAIHPLLFRRHYDDMLLRKITTAYINAPQNRGTDFNSQYVFEDFQVFTDYEIHRWCLSPEQPGAVRKFALKGQPWLDDSAKVKKLVTMLQEHARNDHKTLVFSQFTMVMDILESALSSSDIPFFRLDGQTKMEQRQEIIDAFHRCPTSGSGQGGDSPCAVFMLSTGAGGQGINLACADRVIIFDSGFNPHSDLQAENRAHRVGQTREVVVTRLISAGTVEEEILRVGEIKIQLDEKVAGVGGESEEGAVEDERVDEKGTERQGKGMVEALLAERVEGGGRAVKDGGEASSPTREDDPESKQVDADTKDLAQAFAEGLKSAGVNVKK